MQWAIPEKKTNRKSWEHTFLKILLKFLVFLLYPWKFQTNQSSTPENCAKLRYIPCQFQDQKKRPLEIPHNFFLVTPRNSACYIFDSPGNSMSSINPPVWFFLEKANVKRGFFHLILVGISSILIFSVTNRGVEVRGLLNGQNLLGVTKVICW